MKAYTKTLNESFDRQFKAIKEEAEQSLKVEDEESLDEDTSKKDYKVAYQKAYQEILKTFPEHSKLDEAVESVMENFGFKVPKDLKESLYSPNRVDNHWYYVLDGSWFPGPSLYFRSDEEAEEWEEKNYDHFKSQIEEIFKDPSINAGFVLNSCTISYYKEDKKNSPYKRYAFAYLSAQQEVPDEIVPSLPSRLQSSKISNKIFYTVYKLDNSGNEDESIKNFKNLDSAIAFAKKQHFPTHIVLVPAFDIDNYGEDAIEYIRDNFGYEPFEVVWSNESLDEGKKLVWVDNREGSILHGWDDPGYDEYDLVDDPEVEDEEDWLYSTPDYFPESFVEEIRLLSKHLDESANTTDVSILKTLHNRIIEGKCKNISSQERTTLRKYGLEEALPKDLMTQIRNAQSYSWRDDDRFNDYDENSNDYANADYKEISAEDVLKMKKNGEDLDNVYIMKNGQMINLDRYGSPYDRGSSMKGLRTNQALKKSLENADKIYLTNIPLVRDSQPDKIASRLADPEQRGANMNLGHKRYNWDRTDALRYKDQIKDAQDKRKEINKLYADGDISRKERDSRLAAIKGPSSYRTKDYQNYRNRQAERRYYASRKTLQAPFDELQDARNTLVDAKNRLGRSERELERIKNDDTSGYNSYGSYNDALEKVNNLKNQIARLQAELAKYQEKIDNGAKEKEIKATADKINKYKDDIEKAQDRIDKVLRRK